MSVVVYGDSAGVKVKIGGMMFDTWTEYYWTDIDGNFEQLLHLWAVWVIVGYPIVTQKVEI